MSKKSLDNRIEEAVEFFNRLDQDERELREKLAAIHDVKEQVRGRIVALRELKDEGSTTAQAKSVNSDSAKNNGHAKNKTARRRAVKQARKTTRSKA